MRVPREDAWIPTLADLSFPAGQFERELGDSFGIRPEGHPMPHRLVRHAHWPSGWHPMRHDAGPVPEFGPDVDAFPFVTVQGDGAYEIPVGPIHAGLIEPGHFRFSVVGETILRMKARLWFLHRGVEKLFEGRPAADGIALAERISGDTAVGHSLAFVQAVEDALGIEVDADAVAVRALLLEAERLHNHVNDLGAIANDVGYGIAHAQTGRLRELLLRHNKALTGHRLLRGGITIGGARLLRPPDLNLIGYVAREAAEIAAIALDHSVVLDRFTGTAVLGDGAGRAHRDPRVRRPRVRPRHRRARGSPDADRCGVRAGRRAGRRRPRPLHRPGAGGRRLRRADRRTGRSGWDRSPVPAAAGVGGAGPGWASWRPGGARCATASSSTTTGG